jgi:CheY-like chemotaxis protein
MSNRTILIAERDRNVRDLEQHFLESVGYAVEFADDGMIALERARVLAPIVIITEILLPRLDGLTLCRQLRQDSATCGIPVIVFSILAAEARAKDAGASAFLRKPLVSSVLLGTIVRLAAHEAHSLTEPQ